MFCLLGENQSLRYCSPVVSWLRISVNIIFQFHSNHTSCSTPLHIYLCFIQLKAPETHGKDFFKT